MSKPYLMRMRKTYLYKYAAMPRTMHNKTISIQKFRLDLSCNKNAMLFYVRNQKQTDVAESIRKIFQTQITWFTVSLSLTLVFLRSEVALSTCERVHKVLMTLTNSEKRKQNGRCLIPLCRFHPSEELAYPAPAFISGRDMDHQLRY